MIKWFDRVGPIIVAAVIVLLCWLAITAKIDAVRSEERRCTQSKVFRDRMDALTAFMEENSQGTATDKTFIGLVDSLAPPEC